MMENYIEKGKKKQSCMYKREDSGVTSAKAYKAIICFGDKARRRGGGTHS